MAQQERGKAVPALDRRPTMPWYFGRWYQDFEILSMSRSSAFNGYNPIDMCSMISYAQAIGVESYELPMFIRVIQYLDSIFLIWQAEKAKKRQSSTTNNVPTQRGKA